MAGHLARWRESLGHKQAQREHLLQQVAKLEGMEKNARSEDFAVQVRGWLQETAEKLRRTEEFIADLEERIRATEKKLGGPGPGPRPPRRGGAGAPRTEAATPPGDEAPPAPEDAPPAPRGDGG
jgi:hypothetical protein